MSAAHLACRPLWRACCPLWHACQHLWHRNSTSLPGLHAWQKQGLVHNNSQGMQHSKGVTHVHDQALDVRIACAISSGSAKLQGACLKVSMRW
jgi:hypothetical protein